VSIRAELGNAVLDGIRERGAEAVGMVIVGLARVVVCSATLVAMLAIGAAFGSN
jgi:hypothetical protein